MKLTDSLIMGAVGLFCGATAAAGVFALITVIGIIPRFAGKTHTAHFIESYEWAVILGGTAANFCYIYEWLPALGTWFLFVAGLGFGCFVGCLAMSLAETLDTFPILIRRLRLKSGLAGMIILAALGKMAGSLWYFAQRK